jgi:radical SAM protein with 4Fe4S-binding SPASM domain
MEQIANDVKEVDPGELNAYLQSLEKEGLGKIEGKPKAHQSLDLHQPHHSLNDMWLELREDCNLKCIHCYCTSGPTVQAKDRLSHIDWCRLLEEGSHLGCKRIQFIGGEPLLYGTKIFNLARKARSLGYEFIEVFSNLTFLKEEWLEQIVELRMNVACSIFADQPEVHDRITTVKGSFEKTIANVKRLKARGIQPRFALIVMKQNQHVVQETLEFFRSLDDPAPSFDRVRPSGRGHDQDIIPDAFSQKQTLQTQALFLKTDRSKFIRSLSGNGCWQGKIAISSTGKVHPCIMQREGQKGDVTKQSLEEILSGPIKKYWDLSLDKIETCCDCEYRYACNDCRPVAAGDSGNLVAKTLHCTYDPYQGEWIDVTQKQL